MREKILFNDGWLFHEGDLTPKFPDEKGIAYISAKTERCHFGPASKDYYAEVESFDINKLHTSECWKNVSLPHDYLIDQRPDPKNNPALGFVEYRNAWYLKRFDIPAEDEGRRLTIFFEGVATHATVYLNGCLLKHNLCGYTSFEVDITEVAKYGRKNFLAVYVNTDEHEGWWYEGAGIYRNVWLQKTDKVAVDLWGVFVKPKEEKAGWNVPVEVTVRNDEFSDESFFVRAELLDADGNVIACGEQPATAKMYDKCQVNFAFTAKNPKLWSPDEVNFYYVRAAVLRGGVEVDSLTDRFGFRTFTADVKNGLLINGKPYKIQGLCGHAGSGLFGKAVPDNIHKYSIQMLKGMGANGYRCSHYPQAAATMDALDEGGFIVMDETRWFECTEEGLAQLEMVVKRDRNRPGVFFWSLGNEEFHFVTEEGRRIAKKMIAAVQKWDDTRPVIIACDRPAEGCTVFDFNDILGVNYNLSYYPELRAAYPDKTVISTECCATGTTRGWYFPDSDRFVCGWDHPIESHFVRTREETWKFIMERPYLLGGYQWHAFEYRGEATWPRLSSTSGAVDFYYQIKDAFYQNKAYWTKEPMVHLLPHWNFIGWEGETFHVVAYTNQPVVELFLNGQSVGKKELAPYDVASWDISYTPGTLCVKAYDKDGRLTATDAHTTTGRPVRLALVQDNDNVTASGEDVALLTCTLLDENGNEVPDGAATVSFFTKGNAKIVATGSDNTDPEPPKNTTRRMRAGKLTVAVKVGKNAQDCKLFAESDGLISAVLTLKIRQ